MRKDCYYCHLNTIDKLLKKFNPGIKETEALTRHVDIFLQHNWQLSNPLLAAHIQRIVKQHIKRDDLYRKEKQEANKLLLDTYSHWEQIVNKSKNPFKTAVKLAVIGNIIDYGAHSVPAKLETFIIDKLNESLAIDHSKDLMDAVKNAKSLLYLGDNAGEIVFDKLLISKMKHPNVTFVVRNEPVLNDATMEDAQAVGLDTVCKVIPNGSDAPSTLLNLCSVEFNNLYKDADVVIAKGQGNFEGLMDSHKQQLFFLLMAKCSPIAEMLSVKKGSMIVKQQNI